MCFLSPLSLPSLANPVSVSRLLRLFLTTDDRGTERQREGQKDRDTHKKE